MIVARDRGGEQAGYVTKALSRAARWAAQKSGVTGKVRLSITIDRSGRLKGARLASSTGSEILDAEALAVASRATPYPVPPKGVGDRTFSFAVTLRFSR